MAARIKKHEKLTETNIQHVINLLTDEKPITKKEACSILNITYNTTRLNNIIAEHNETKRYRELRKSQNKGKGVTEAEKKSIVAYYLQGSNISDIAKALYRSPAFIKAVIERLGIPQKLPDSDYEGIKNAMLPEECVSDTFEVGQKVWAVRKNCIATILREDTRINYEEKHGAKYYILWITEMAECESPYFGSIKNAGHYSGSLAYDLGSLKHLEQYL